MAARKNTTPAQIINRLRKAEVELANGKSVREVCKGLGISEHTYSRWRREYNTIRPHSSPGYRPPAPEAIRPDPGFLNLPVLRGPDPRGQEWESVRQ